MVINSMSYAKYDSYKDSGVDWLGEIPSDWDLVPLRAIFRFRNEKNNPIITENILSLSIAKGVTSYDENRGGNKRKDDITAYKIARPNDIVLNSMNVIVGAVGVSKYFGAISPVYYALYAFNDLGYVPYFNWIFQNTGFQKGLLKYGKGILIKLGEEGKMNTIRMKISQDDLKVLQFPLPNFEKQTKIANFLDQKTAQIDQAIALKQQQIEKLNEYKQIVIQNAVTKGLDPNAPMKNSGVAWIGDIPEHWDVIRFRNAFRFNKGLNITKENLNDEQGILCLNYGEIHSKYGFEFIPKVHPLKFVDESYLKNNQKSLLNNGDFVFADTSEDIEGSGNFSYINGQDLVFAGYHTLIAKPKINFNSRFIAYVLDSSAFRNQVRLRVKGVKVFSITQAILKTTFIWLPTEQEQNEIVKYLDEKMQKFNNAKIAYQIQIDRLKEYKNILINQAVTGKIKI